MTHGAPNEIERGILTWLMGSFNHQETPHGPPKVPGRLSCGGAYNSRADNLLNLIVIL